MTAVAARVGPHLPRTLMCLDEPYLRIGDAYYSASLSWRFLRKLVPHCRALTFYVPLREAESPNGAVRTDLPSVRVVGRPYYQRIQQYYARLPAWHRGLARQAAELVDAHDLVVCRLPAPSAKFVIRAAAEQGKPVALLVAGDVVSVTSWIVGRSPLVAWFGRRAANHLRRQEFGWARQSAFIGVWGNELRDLFRPWCSNVAVCEDPNIEEKDLTWRDDACTRRPVRILRVCQYLANKGIDVLIRSAANLIDQKRDVTVDVVGPWLDAAHVESLHRLRDELNLTDRVSLHGSQDFGEPLFRFYRQADIHAITSYSEGIPRCIAEGRAFSVPTVATNVGGIPDVIRHEHDGLLVPPGDVDALTAAMGRLIDDAPLRRRIITNGFERARQSTAEFHAERLARLIAEAIARPV